MSAALKRESRQGLASATPSAISDVLALVTGLTDYLTGLYSHPWDFDLAYVQTQLTAIQSAINRVPQKLADAQSQAIQPDVAQLLKVVAEIQQMRAQAERQAAAAKDALDKALNRPRLSTTGPATTDQFAAPNAAQVALPNPGRAVSKVTNSHQAAWDALSEQLVTLASKAHVSAQQDKPSASGTSGSGAPALGAPGTGQQNSGTPGSGAQGSGTSGSGSASTKWLFEAMPNFDVVETETLEFDFYVFGYLQGTPRIEGRRTTTSYQLQFGNPMPGALGICRRFVDATRQAGGEVLYDNNRNFVTSRFTQGGGETWAEIGCDKDRYRVNIVERQGAGQSKSDTTPDQSNPTKMKELNAKVRDAVRANADKAFDELSAEEAKRTNVAAPAAGSGQGAAPKSNTSGQFSIVADNGGSASLATPVPCTDPPTQMRQLSDRKVWSRIVLKRGVVNEIRASQLNLVDTNTWSCHTKDGTEVEGALVTGRPLN